MWSNIEMNVKRILKKVNIFDEDYHIEFGEDCFNIVITGKGEIFTDIIDELKDCFNNSELLIKVNDEGNIVINCDIIEGRWYFD